MRVLASITLFAAVACSSGAEHGNVFGNSIGSGQAGDDGAATKGNPTMPGSDDASDEWGEIEESSSSSGEALDESSSSTGAPEPAASSSDDGDVEDESTGAPSLTSDADDDAGDPGEPMYSPCDPNGSDCADGFCLVIEDQNHNVIGSFCTGPCALPDQDCDLPASGNAEPACVVSNEGPSICTLDCGGGETCPDGMQCIEFPGAQLRCV